MGTGARFSTPTATFHKKQESTLHSTGLPCDDQESGTAQSTPRGQDPDNWIQSENAIYPHHSRLARHRDLRNE